MVQGRLPHLVGSDADSSDSSDCRNKRAAMSKLFGEWPIDMFEDMPKEQQKAFWKGPFWKAVASQAMMHGESIGVDAANSCMGRPLARGKPC